MTLVLWMGLLGCTAVPIKEGVYGPDMGDGKGPPVTGLKPSQFFTAELKASGDAFSTDKKIDAALSHLKAMNELGVSIDYCIEGDTHGIQDYMYLKVNEGAYCFIVEYTN